MNVTTCGNCEATNSKVLTILTRLETKMDMIVGTDGTGGRLKAVEEKVEQLQLEQTNNQGMLSGASKTAIAVWTILLAISEYLIHKR